MFDAEENSYYGIMPLSSSDYADDSLTLKSPPEFPLSAKRITIRDYYSTDTFIIKNRLKKLLTFSIENFFDDYLPDLYGPIWISITINLLFIFLCYSLNNTFEIYFSLILCIYFLYFSVPLLVYLLQNKEESHLSYFLLLSSYGYSWIYFIFAALITLANIKYASLTAWVVASLASLWFLKKTLWVDIKIYIPRFKFIALTGVAVGKLIMLGMVFVYLLI